MGGVNASTGGGNNRNGLRDAEDVSWAIGMAFFAHFIVANTVF